ncbi:hypothetical protein D9757_010084 [Collybiopsis confluens]|uniref:Uncharacterized protein n=1 Tax=Collybiopsis confluens TaxID=2823264 RepID=A0A8H5LRY8_9AGAR|nr:hypothetical protein D9757_010084 [Collybiopsis confluens]
MITADDSYSIYINGRFIGSGTSGFSTAQRFVANVQGPAVTFAVYAVNGNDQPNPAGLLASIQVTSQDEITCNDCNSTSFVVSSYAWKTFPGPVPDGFEQPTFDDSAWVPSTIIGQNGVTPWGTIAAPTTITTGGTPVPGAPAGSA